MTQRRQNILTPIGVWIHQRLINSSEKTTEQYYKDLNKSQLSIDLIDRLEKLLGNQKHLRDIFKKRATSNEDGILHWEEDNFRDWITVNQPLLNISDLIPRLWHIFIYFGGYPFTDRILRDFDVADQIISEDGFVQAYILLALRGVEILGNGRDGFTAKGDVENTWSQKFPRLSTLLFDGLKSSSSEDKQSRGLSNKDPANFAEEQFMNAIVLTQPVPYMTGLSFENNLRGTARRLLIENVASNYDKPYSFDVSKTDFQTLIGLCLQLRLGDNPRKQGLVLHQTTRMCGDVESWSFVAEEQEILLSRRLSHAFAKYKLGNVDSISRESFEAVCAAYPSIVLGFYHLWTAICVSNATTPTLHDLGSELLNCVAQFLYLISPVEFDSSLPAGWNEDKRQLQLDLQKATLMADSTVNTTLDESWLVEKLSNDQHFHILFIAAEEVHGGTADTTNIERLIALFTSPPDNQIPFWNCPGCTTYIWRYGFVQLLPHILTLQTGGLSASFQHDTIKFFPHAHSDYQSSSVKVDLRNEIVVIEWVNSPVLTLKLKSLKCYRMPGTAVTIHKSSKI